MNQGYGHIIIYLVGLGIVDFAGANNIIGGVIMSPRGFTNLHVSPVFID